MNTRSSAAVALLLGLTLPLFAAQQSAVNAQNFSRQHANQAEQVAAEEEEVQKPVKKRKKRKGVWAAQPKKPVEEPEAKDIFKLFNFNKPAAQQAETVE